MISKPVKLTKDISTEVDGTFLYCREIRKGLIKRNIAALNLSSTTFGEVVTAIESMALEDLVANNLDSVLFTPEATIDISDRRTKEVSALLENMELGEERDLLIATLREQSDYFPDNI